MRTTLFIALIILSMHCFATSTYYPQEILNIIENQDSTKSELKEALFNLLDKIHLQTENDHDQLVSVCPINAKCISQNLQMSYKEARTHLFGNLHLEKNQKNEYFIKDVYCNKEITSKDGVGKNKIPNHEVINCEHTWPQSKFSKQFSNAAQKSDLHHLYPTDMKANSTRSNNHFANVNGRVVNSSCTDSKTGTEEISGMVAFEPPSEHKGNVARAMFYFSVRYKMPLNATERLYLEQWHLEDPVDEQERKRNEMIMEIQGNRNPFIDYPELVGRIF